MKKSLLQFSTWLTTLCMAFATGYATSAQAQDETFSPYRGTCWGMFYDQTAETLVNTMVPVRYDRPAFDKFVFPNFLDCGRDLNVTLTNEGLEEGYYDIYLEMEGGLYDDYGYFYPPFINEPFKYTFKASNGELVGPVLMPYSYYHEPLEYMGFFYVRYPQTEFGYFDIKMSEDYYADSPREYYDVEDVNSIDEIAVSSPVESTYYNLAGRRAAAAEKGIMIESGRKVMR